MINMHRDKKIQQIGFVSFNLLEIGWSFVVCYYLIPGGTLLLQLLLGHFLLGATHNERREHVRRCSMRERTGNMYMLPVSCGLSRAGNSLLSLTQHNLQVGGVALVGCWDEEKRK